MLQSIARRIVSVVIFLRIKKNARWVESFRNVSALYELRLSHGDSYSKNIALLLRKGDELGIITSYYSRRETQSVLFKLLVSLLEESLRPSSYKNYLGIDITYFIIEAMMQMDPEHNKHSILLLPRVLVEMNLFQACYYFLKMIELKRIPKQCLKTIRSFNKESNSGNICEPIQLFCERKCDVFLICDMVFIKLRMKDIISSMKYFSELKLFRNVGGSCSDLIEKKLYDTIGEYLNVSKDWRRMNLRVLGRQALDLLKLVQNINPVLLSSYIRQIERNEEMKYPISCVSLHFWSKDKSALQFIREAISS